MNTTVKSADQQLGKKVLIFTRTDWNEPPRIRHQLTRLLQEMGYEIVFFEKARFRNFTTKHRKEEGIDLFKHFELLNHNLRFNRLLVYLNKLITKALIQKILARTKVHFIVNFNYDFYFLRELFPDKKIITFINDDFVSRVNRWGRKSAQYQFRKTCENADYCLAVSTKLVEMVSEFNGKSEMFLPWAGRKYNSPKSSITRDIVLYWGFINNRIDWNVIHYLLEKNVKIRMIGPIAQEINSQISLLKEYKNLTILKSCGIEEIDFSDICCSIILYDRSDALKESYTVSNRTFQLLSYGIPLVYTKLPNLIAASENVIATCENKDEFLNAIKFFQKNFHSVQGEISDFLMHHYADDRKKQFESILNRIQAE